MSAVEQRTKTTVRHEYYVKAPACWTDIEMAMKLAIRDMEAAGLQVYDNSIMVDFDDDNVITFWNEEKK